MKDIATGLLAAAFTAVGVLVLAFVWAAVLAIPIMLLWDYTVPYLFPGTKEIDFWHAMTLVVLCSFLFKSPRQLQVLNMNPRNVFRAYQGLLVERQLRADSHRFTHLAIGFRTDGATVLSFNNTDRTTRTWSSHAEARLSRKLDVHSSVYVMRLHKNQDWALSAPCESCLRCMIRKGVSKVYFTTGPESYGTIRL